MHGRMLERRTFRRQFDPRAYPKKTYLLCELEWGNSGRSWKHWVSNDCYSKYHAEEYFLEEIFEPRSYNFCNITLYLSWSPCSGCCDIIQNFLESQPNVEIDIRVARLYYPELPVDFEGLRELHSLPEVTIEVMEQEDYEYCWWTFTQGGVNYDYLAMDFQAAIERNRLMLEDILTGLL